MQIEVIVNGKGSITIAQKVDLDRKALQKLTRHCTDLLKGARKAEQYGFDGGASLNSEIAED